MMQIFFSKIFWEIANFLVLIILLYRFLYKRVLAVIDARREKINSDLTGAENAKQEANKLLHEYNAKLADAKSEADEIIKVAEKRANNRREEILETANEDAQKIKDRAMGEIQQAKRQALSQLRDEVSGISLMIAEKLMKESIDAEKHQALVLEFIDQLDNEKLGEAKC